MINKNIVVGKKIMASNGRKRVSSGTIKQINFFNSEVLIYNRSNPEGYKYYSISLADCSEWFNEGLYI